MYVERNNVAPSRNHYCNGNNPQCVLFSYVALSTILCAAQNCFYGEFMLSVKLPQNYCGCFLRLWGRKNVYKHRQKRIFIT